MAYRQLSLFNRMTLDDAIDMTASSLTAYGSMYKHWAVAFSGGKDSSATVTVLMYLIESGQVPAPESLTVLYADTRMELPPLQAAAFGTLAELERRGIRTQVVLPPMDQRFYVYMFGRGVPPPKNRFRWCTPQIKVKPMESALAELADTIGEKFLMITGVRMGESAARDQRIAVSCTKDGGECGQGWFQQTSSKAVADVLAPIVHWRVCHVWDYLTFYAPSQEYGVWPTATVADAYGGEEAEEVNARTGCVGCNLVSKDLALDTLLKQPEWSYLRPFKRLKPLYRELKQAKFRLRKDGSERKANGQLVKNPMRMGPLVMSARRYGLGVVLGIQKEINEAALAKNRPAISLINDEELVRIEELIAANTWPRRWSGEEPSAIVPLDEVIGEGIVQPRLFV